MTGVPVAPLTRREARAARPVLLTLKGARQQITSLASGENVDMAIATLEQALAEYDARPWWRRPLPLVSDAPRLSEVLARHLDYIEGRLRHLGVDPDTFVPPTVPPEPDAK